MADSIIDLTSTGSNVDEALHELERKNTKEKSNHGIGTQPVESIGDKNNSSHGKMKELSSDVWGWLQPTPSSKLNALNRLGDRSNSSTERYKAKMAEEKIDLTSHSTFDEALYEDEKKSTREESECDEVFGTQPFQLVEDLNNLSHENFEELNCSDAWGWLQPTPFSKLKALTLVKESYSFGRHLTCDYIFKEEDFENAGLFKTLSKHQFRVERKIMNKDVEAVFLYDLSSNGTYVNDHKVGQGEHVILTNNDEISLIVPVNKVFVFIERNFPSNWLVPEMKSRFILKVMLGSGGYGEVRMARDKRTNKDVAIKKIAKVDGEEDSVSNEIEILRNLKNIFIVSMEDFFDSPKHMYIVLEYIPGGTLGDKLETCSKLKDDEAKFFFYQLVLALEFLHGKNIAHRDLKPENVLLAPYKDGELIKVSDFGMSKIVLNTDLKTMCGTPLYVAPEVLMTKSQGTYTLQVDIWSLGVTLFFCLSGVLPFRVMRGAMSVTDQIVRGSYSVRTPEWRGVHPKSVNLTKSMLVVDPNERITIPEILKHPWLQDDGMKKKLDKVIKSATDGERFISPSHYLDTQSNDSVPGPAKRPRHNADTVRKS